MQFGPWTPLSPMLDGSSVPALPAAAGVFQLRVESGLVAYPRGKSAMVAYGGGDDLRASLGEFLRSDAGRRALGFMPLLVRFAAPDPHGTPASHLARLRARFIDQFGSLPVAEVAPFGPGNAPTS